MPCNFYKIDLKTGAATKVSAGPVACGDGLTFDDDGTLFAYRNASTAGTTPSAQLITIDKHTGVQHVVGPLPPVLVSAGGMTFDADGDLWLYATTVGGAPCTAGVNSFCLWKVDPATAASTFVGTAPAGRGVFGLAGDCEDVIAITLVFPAGPVTPNVELDEVHTSSAALEKTVDLPGVTFPTGLDFDADGDLWALANTDGTGAGISAILYRIDPDDGTSHAKDLTIGGVPFNSLLNGLAVSPIHCEDPESTPTTAPPAPVVVAPVFTG